MRVRIALSVLWAAGCLLGASLPATAEQAPTVDQLEVCMQCHDLERELSAPVGHSPARSGDCTACHNPHAARHQDLLLERPAVLCAKCHSNIASTLTLPYRHLPASEGKCSACHEPHGGQRSNLLVASSSDLCSTCHASVQTWLERPVRHPPFAQARCGTCHDPHGGSYPNLGTNEPGKICGSCHSNTEHFRAVHKGYPVGKADCGQCHDPHASARAGLFREQIHSPFAGGRCSTCHAAATANEPFGLVKREDELCGGCHSAQVEANQTAPFPHAAAGGSQCSACHNPHSGEGGALLKSDLQTTCLGCHDPGGAKSQETGRYVSHEDDMDCDTCHSSHGGDRPLLLTAEPIELCGMCHSHQHAITHPMGESALDPRNSQPMDCLSCHAIHSAQHSKYLYKDGDRDLCVGCHQQKGIVQ